MNRIAGISLTPVRKAAVLFTGISVFSSSMYLTYHFQRMEKQAVEFEEQRRRRLQSEGEGENVDDVREGKSSLPSSSSSSSSNSRCCSCSYLNDPKRNQQYDVVAKGYDDSVRYDELFMGMNLLRRFLLYFHAKGTVLEMGAGTGRNLQYYPMKNITTMSPIAQQIFNSTNSTNNSKNNTNKVDRVILTDISEPMLQQAKEKIARLPKQQQKRYATLVANVEYELQTKIPDNSFDTVVDTFGLCSYNDPVAVLNEMERVCKKQNGKILLLEHGRSHNYTFITNYLDKFAEQHAYNWGCVWNRDIDQIIEQSNVVVDHMYKFHFGTTYYIVCRPQSTSTESSSVEEEL